MTILEAGVYHSTFTSKTMYVFAVQEKINITASFGNQHRGTL